MSLEGPNQSKKEWLEHESKRRAALHKLRLPGNPNIGKWIDKMRGTTPETPPEESNTH